jgi:hypothetical protein
MIDETHFPLAFGLLSLFRRPDSTRLLRWVAQRELTRIRRGIPSILA